MPLSLLQNPFTLKPDGFDREAVLELVMPGAGEYLCYGHDIKPKFHFPKPKAFNVKVEKA